MLNDLVIGMQVTDALKTVTAFNEMVSSRGTVEGDEDVLGDGNRVRRSLEVSGTREVRLARMDGIQGCCSPDLSTAVL